MECPECGKNFYGMQMMIQNVSVIFAASLICGDYEEKSVNNNLL